MIQNNSTRPLPPPDGLVEPYKTAYLEFSKETRELMLNPKQLYAMHLRKRSKLIEKQRYPDQKRKSQDPAKKKDKTKSRSIFASNRPRDAKGRFFTKDSQDLSEATNGTKEQVINTEPIKIEASNEEVPELVNWGVNQMDEEDIFAPISLCRWDSTQYPQTNSSLFNEDYYFYNDNY